MVISSLSILANISVLIFHHTNVKIRQSMPKWVFLAITKCSDLCLILNFHFRLIY